MIISLTWVLIFVSPALTASMIFCSSSVKPLLIFLLCLEGRRAATWSGPFF